MNRLGTNLMLISIIGIVAAVAWWSIYFREMIDLMAGPEVEIPVRCLITTSGECWIIRGLGNLRGALAYEPVVFWISCGGFFLGLILKISFRRK